jgi:hypothetical protein
MFGHKAKIYYRGIKKTCTNCYQSGHFRKDCHREKLDWIDYVSTFINSNEHIPEEMFGRWYQLCIKRAQEGNKTSDDVATTHPPMKPLQDEPETRKEPRTDGREKKITKRLPTKASSSKSKPNT